MAKILEMLDARKAQLRSMRESNPEEFVRDVSRPRGSQGLLQQEPIPESAPEKARKTEQDHNLNKQLELLNTNQSVDAGQTHDSLDDILATLKKIQKTLDKGVAGGGLLGGAAAGGGSMFDFISTGSKEKGAAGAAGSARKAGLFGRITAGLGRGMSGIARMGGTAAKALLGAEAVGALAGKAGSVTSAVSRAAAPITEAASGAWKAGAEYGSKALSAGGKLLGHAAAPLAAVGTVMDVAGAQEKARQEGRNETGAGVSTALTSAATLGLGGMFGINNVGDVGGALTNVATLGQAPEIASSVSAAINTGFDKMGSGIEAAMDYTGLGTTIGRVMTAAQATWSEDAREVLRLDWKNNISPGLEKRFKEFDDSFQMGVGALTDSVKNFKEQATKVVDSVTGGFSSVASAAWSTIKNAGSNLLSGNGKGAWESLRSGGSDLWDKTKKAASNIASTAVEAYNGLGSISAKHESGGRGVGTVSTGAGDAGGVSYGRHQLATNNGSMAAFINSGEAKAFAPAFAGLKPGTPEFNEAYKRVSASQGDAFGKAQQDYIKRTHFDPAANKLQADTGIDVSKRGAAVQEMVFSTSVQYGKTSNVMKDALAAAGLDPKSATDAQIVQAVQDYKAQTTGKYFKSSSAGVQASVASRAQAEKKELLALDANKTPAVQDGTPSAAAKSQAQSGTSTAKTGATGANKAVAASPKSVATPAPQERIAKDVPRLSQPVTVASMPPIVLPEQKSASTQIVQPSGPSNKPPTLDDIPVFFPNLAMVNIMSGKT